MLSKEYLEKAVLPTSRDVMNIINSHLELYTLLAEKEKEIEVYKKESVLKNQLINQYKSEIEGLKEKAEFVRKYYIDS
jgi:hypothetical protein